MAAHWNRDMESQETLECGETWEEVFSRTLRVVSSDMLDAARKAFEGLYLALLCGAVLKKREERFVRGFVGTEFPKTTDAELARIHELVCGDDHRQLNSYLLGRKPRRGKAVKHTVEVWRADPVVGPVAGKAVARPVGKFYPVYAGKERIGWGRAMVRGHVTTEVTKSRPFVEVGHYGHNPDAPELFGVLEPPRVVDVRDEDPVLDKVLYGPSDGRPAHDDSGLAEWHQVESALGNGNPVVHHTSLKSLASGHVTKTKSLGWYITNGWAARWYAGKLYAASTTDGKVEAAYKVEAGNLVKLTKGHRTAGEIAIFKACITALETVFSGRAKEVDAVNKATAEAVLAHRVLGLLATT